MKRFSLSGLSSPFNWPAQVRAGAGPIEQCIPRTPMESVPLAGAAS